MKRKYFFGILLSLFLLCGGVYLLTADIEYIDFNNQLDDVAHATDINIHIGEVYGYDTLGANITIQYGVSNSSGNFAKTHEHIVYTDTAKNSKILGASVNSKSGYDHRKIKFTNFSVASGLYATDSKLDCVADATDNKYDDDWYGASIGPGVRLFTWNVEVANRYTGISWNFTIYWTVNLTLYANDGTSDYTTIRYSTYDNKLTSSLTIPTRSGYTFQGYYTAESGGTKVFDKNGTWLKVWDYTNIRPTTLYARWTPNTYTIVYHGNGNTGGSTASSSHTYDTAKALTSNGFTKSGYRFIGWSTSANGSVVYSDGQNVTNLTATNGGTVNLYAQWERYEYKIDINFYQPNGSTQNGGTFDLYKQLSGGSETLIQKGLSNEIEGSASLQYEGKFILKNVLPLTGTTISSVRLSNGNGTLSTSGKTINGKTIIDTITYTASQTGPPNGDGNWDNAIQIYTAYNTLTATLKYQDDATADAKRSATYNSNRTSLPTLPSSPTRTGYRFLGWSLTQNDTGVYYTPESDFNNVSINGKTVSDPNVENLSFNLYAIWQANQYTIEFNKNSNQAIGIMAEQKFTFGTAQNLSANAFNRSGYKFLGWSLNANATTADYADKASVLNLTANANEKITFYAVWEIKTNTLTIDLDGGVFQGKLLNNNQYTQSLQSYQMTFLETPIKAGYIFAGWEISGNATIELAQYYLSPKEFNGTSDYQAIGREYMYTDKLTINLFGYMDDWSSYAPDQRLISCTEGGGWDLAFHNSEYICAEFYQQNVGYTNVKLNTKWSSVERGWHMFTMVFDKDYAYLYIDGELSGKSVKFTNGLQYNSTNGVFIGAEAGSSMTTPVGQYFKGSIQNVMLTHGYISGIKDIYSQTFSTSNNLNNNYVLIMGSESSTIKAKWISTEVIDNSRENEINQKFNQSYKISISSEQDLYDLLYYSERNEIGSGYSFIQTTNLTLTKTWLPIGRLESFTATYDGQGYTIKGINTDNTITNKNGEYLERYGGLFANASGAKIRNVIIEDATIYGQNAGIIAGSGNSSTNISNCVVSGIVNGTKTGSIVGNGNGCQISVSLAEEVNIANFAGGSASVDSCIYELTGGTRGASNSFNNYSAWIYPSNFAYPMPKAFIWYPYPELTKDSLNTWISG